jgi:AraC-like DNA-binding protein
MQRLLPSRILTGIADLIASYDQNPDLVAQSVGLDPKLLYQTDLSLEAQDYNALMEAASLICDDQFFLLRLAEIQDWRLLGAIEPLLRQAQTIGKVLELLAAYTEQHSEGLFLYLEKNSAGSALCFEVRAYATFDPQQTSGRLHNVDLGMAMFCREFRRQLGSDWHPRFVQFQYTAPDIQGPLRHVFGENLHFNQDVNSIYLRDEELEHSFKAQFDSAQMRIEDGADLSTERHIPILLRVDRAIRLLINRGDCSASQVAEALNMKLRTLQHQLQKENTRYQTLYDEVRLDLARIYLNDSDLSIGAISERLHFTDSAAFSNFFRNETGCTPRIYRQELRLK